MKFENHYLFEILQLSSLVAGLFGFVPEIKKVFTQKHIATENLSLVTTSIFVLETMIRLPNIGLGLFAAIQSRNSSNIKRLVMVILGIFIVGISFYLMLVGIAKYNTDRTKQTKNNRKIARVLSIIYGILISGIVIFFIYGIYKSIKSRK